MPRTLLEALALVPLIGCVDVHLAPDANDSELSYRIDEGSPEAFGILALLNDAGTTETLLDDDIALDSRAATSLSWHRDGPDGVFGTSDDDLYDTVAEADAQHWVGPAALDRLAAYALANGFVPSGDDTVGSWDGVPFTWDELAWTLDVANNATHTELDITAAMNRSAVDSIVAARPIDTMDTLAGLYRVGPAALFDLQTYAVSLQDIKASEGEDCNTSDDCAEGLTCLGELLWPGNGLFCQSDDLSGTFSQAPDASIPDADPTGLQSSVEVVGLASVPVDVLVTLDIDHPRPEDLLVILEDCNGQTGVVWDHEAAPPNEVIVRAFPSDDEVHGTWTLHVTDTAAGVEGTLRSWELYIVSTFD